MASEDNRLAERRARGTTTQETMAEAPAPVPAAAVQQPRETGRSDDWTMETAVPPLQRHLRLQEFPAAKVECRDNLEFLGDLADGSIKLIVTSPPYNLGKEYETRAPVESYLEAQREVIAECVRVLHPQGSICWQVGNYVSCGTIVPLDVVLYPIFQKHGLQLRNRIVWHFGHGLHCTRRLSGRYETINWWTKSDDYTWHLDPIRVPAKYPGKRSFKGPNAGKLSCNPKGKNPSDVWEIPNVKSNHPEKTIHPCQFPVELVERLVLSMTNPGDTVLDPYMGVGSTVIAALKNDRPGYGCDIVPEYVDIARERIQRLEDGTLRTRPMGKPVYDPTLPYGGH